MSVAQDPFATLYPGAPWWYGRRAEGCVGECPLDMLAFMPPPQPAVPQRPTIRDVAAVAGVSKSLVSRAFVDPGRVGEESLRRIMEAAGHLGFRPSWSARTLNNSDGGFTGIVVSDLYSPALAPIVIGAHRRLEAAGRRVLLCSASLNQPGADRALENAAIAFLGDLRPQDLLIVGAVRDATVLEPLATFEPTVVAGARGVSIPAAAEVFTDDEAGLSAVIDHLWRLGHSRIAHVSGIGRVGEARAVAYERAMDERGLSEHVRIDRADFEEAAGYAAGRRLLALPHPPTAITTAGDPAALGVLAAVRELGTGTSVVGYGNAPASGYHLAQLTTVDPDNQAIGAAAAEVLLEADPVREAPPRQIRVAPRLVERSTTGPPLHR